MGCTQVHKAQHDFSTEDDPLFSPSEYEHMREGEKFWYCTCNNFKWWSKFVHCVELNLFLMYRYVQGVQMRFLVFAKNIQEWQPGMPVIAYLWTVLMSL